MTDSATIRDGLAVTLHRDLIGPLPDDDAALAAETLPERPSHWYLTGFLVPMNAPQEQRINITADSDLGATEGGAQGREDAGNGDAAAPPTAFLPSSIGLSVFVPPDCAAIDVRVCWGDYRPEAAPVRTDAAPEPDAPDEETEDAETGAEHREDADAPAVLPEPRELRQWRRTARAETVTVPLTPGRTPYPVPDSDGLALSVLVGADDIGPADARRRVTSVSVFLVNQRSPERLRRLADRAFAFQASLSLGCAAGFEARPDPRAPDPTKPDEWDECVADLHYAEAADYGVGHNVAADWSLDAHGACRHVRTTWMPLARVPRVAANSDAICVRDMKELGYLADAAAARAALMPLADAYRTWIEERRRTLRADMLPRRRKVAAQLLEAAESAANRIADGIATLDDPQVLAAFRLANRAVATARRRRAAQDRRREGKKFDPEEGERPRWYPFQLAFLLLNLRGLVEPTHPERECFDLLFFPTGGGKTEAYLGLAAFAIGLRRLRHPGLGGAGLTVLMRYTLRLLTLDQLSRAATMICALELEREADPAQWGDWPIEIALWVGDAATPNRMGRKGEADPKHRTARKRAEDFCAGRGAPPVPLTECPWCGTPFKKGSSIDLKPNWDNPIRLDLFCTDQDRACDFYSGKGRPLPVQAVDEPIYRRLPAFMIATVDKFAAMPWKGEVGAFFGDADRHDPSGFYGPAEPGRGEKLPAPLLPPDLIIQDELHLISGPLGTMVGLYETALDALCTRTIDRRCVRPKMIASTATVRAATRQVRALFDRGDVRLFPPPGPDRRDSFFARSRDAGDPSSRVYLGIATPGGGPKIMFKRAAMSVLSAAQAAWNAGGAAADPYMTLLCYFNALRELGSAGRIVQGEIAPELEKYDRRPRMAKRDIAFEVEELTSRVGTDQVARTRERLGRPFTDRERLDVVLATNMISVGLDIPRLGLMLVSGQPKTMSEYIQATSRVGRIDQRPGLVVVLLNVNKPRDRSHYERFRGVHDSFYRAVEAASVTPFSPRALDRGLAPVMVALARLGIPALTPPNAAGLIAAHRPEADARVDRAARRAGRHHAEDDAALAQTLRGRALALLDDWRRIAAGVAESGVRLPYEHRKGVTLLHEMLEEPRTLRREERPFRTPRSLRDVEPAVLVRVLTPAGDDAT